MSRGRNTTVAREKGNKEKEAELREILLLRGIKISERESERVSRMLL